MKNGQKYWFCNFDQNGTFRLHSLKWTRWRVKGVVFEVKQANENTTSIVCRNNKEQSTTSLSFFLPSSYTLRPVMRWTDGCNEYCISLGTHTTTLTPFILSTQAVVVQFSVESRNAHYYINTVYFVHTSWGCAIQCCWTLNAFILNSGFSFVHNLHIIFLWVFNGSRLFWSYSKEHWVLYNMVCETPFQSFGTFHLGLTLIETTFGGAACHQLPKFELRIAQEGRVYKFWYLV